MKAHIGMDKIAGLDRTKSRSIATKQKSVKSSLWVQAAAQHVILLANKSEYDRFPVDALYSALNICISFAGTAKAYHTNIVYLQL